MANLSDNIIVISGLNLTYPIGGYGTGLQNITINKGNISFNATVNTSYGSWEPKYIYNQLSALNVKIPTNGGNYQKLVSVYCFPDYNNRISNDVYGLIYRLQEGTAALNPVLPSDIEGGLFLGTMLLPGMFPALSSKVYYRSLNITNDESNFGKTALDYNNYLIKEVEEWATEQLYFESQIIRYNETLWVCNNTHASSASFTTDQDYFWTQMSGGGNGTGGVGSCSDIQNCMYEQVVENIGGSNYLVTYMIVGNSNYKPILKTEKI